jgi:hypothetical protein
MSLNNWDRTGDLAKDGLWRGAFDQGRCNFNVHTVRSLYFGKMARCKTRFGCSGLFLGSQTANP